MNEFADTVAGECARGAASPAVATARTAVLAGVPRAEIPGRLSEKLKQIVPAGSLLCVDTFQRLQGAANSCAPRVIVVDDRILGRAPLPSSLAELAAASPLIVVAPYARHAEIGELVSAGRADFVPRAADWESLAANLIERRLRRGRDGETPVEPRDAPREDLGEIFRHEINNPLTGILGNAEMLLAHSEKFPAAETQRIRTMVELAVRLRETVRRVSNTWGRR